MSIPTPPVDPVPAAPVPVAPVSQVGAALPQQAFQEVGPRASVFSVTMLVFAIIGLIAFFPAIFLMAFLLLSPSGYSGIVFLIVAQIVLSMIVFAFSLVAQRQADRLGEKVSTATAAVIVSAIGMSFNLLLGAFALLSNLPSASS